ncbi:MAG: tetratricopeptide repeat protein [Kiritimatiellia bacterium]|nr:tetratricopeptide repeat protein [Kiritimatiellia bacterium]
MKRARVAVRCLGTVALVALAGCSGGASPQQEYQKGLADLHDGRLEQGKARIEAALEQAPDAAFAAEAQNWLGLANRELGQVPEAMAHFELASHLAPTTFNPIYNLGCLALESGDTSRGLSLLRQAADVDPTDTKALLHIGEWTTRNGRWDLAKRMYYEIQKRDAQSAAAAAGLGRIALLEEALPQAETFFMQALELHKDYPPALYNLGVLHTLMEGHGEQAQEYFRQYLLAAPTGQRVEVAVARIGGQTVEQTSFSPQGPTQPKMTAGIHWAKAQEALAAGDADTAYLQAMRALELARAGADAAQAGEILRRATEVFPDRAAVHLAAGEYWLGQQQPRKAQAALLKAQALEPDNPMVLFELARASARVEEFDTVVISLRKLVQLEPGNPDALWTLAKTYGDELGMAGRGMAVYREFERQFPSDPRAAEVAARIQALEQADAALPELVP